MTIRKSDFLFYLAKQSAKGTAATTATIKMGVKGGAPEVGSDIQEDLVTGMPYATEAFLQALSSGFGFEARAYPAFLGMALAGVMGGVVNSGAAAPYSHVFTAADDTPWHTAWAKLGPNFVKVTDAKFDSVGISWSMNEPLLIDAVMASLDAAFLSTAPTGGTDLLGAAKFTPGGGTFKVSGHNATVATVPLTKFSITPSRDITPEYISGTITPGDLTTNPLKCPAEVIVKPTSDLALYLAAITGSPTGTTPAVVLVTGSFEMNLTIAAGVTLKIEAAKVPWETSWPDADPAGGAVELKLSCKNLLGTSSVSPVTFTLTDAIATY